MNKADAHSKVVLAIVFLVVVLATVTVIFNVKKPQQARVGAQVQTKVNCASISDIREPLIVGNPSGCGSFTLVGTLDILINGGYDSCKNCGGWAKITCSTEIKSDATKKKFETRCKEICAEDDNTKNKGCTVGSLSLNEYITDVKFYDCQTMYEINQKKELIWSGLVTCEGAYNCYCHANRVKISTVQTGTLK